ncbi:S1 RNA-binding domain-containing protein 1-like isoform X2 [Symsagittifera roscoffensis]|uniref:S1 RNA-binding domain-containing protein 1-like isoform X2 n=1 Tax=Symsagittifera roscoffensis TaxID=84072 RepID=UPI00307BE3E6
MKIEPDQDEGHDPLIVNSILAAFSNFPKPEVEYLLLESVDNNSTIPFIERYRKSHVQNLSPNDMREVLETYEELNQTRKASLNFLKKNRTSLLKSEESVLSNCVVKDELDQVKESFKARTNKKWTADHQNLVDNVVEDVLRGVLKYEDDVNRRLKDFQQEKPNEIVNLVKASVVNRLIAECFEYLNNVKSSVMTDSRVMLQSELKKTSKTDKKTPKSEKKEDNVETYAPYHNFRKPVCRMMSYQVMAINRGETHKILKVSIDIPVNYENSFYSFVQNYLACTYKVMLDNHKSSVLTACVSDCFVRVKSKITRHVRSCLKSKAIKDSLETLQKNLKQTLAAEPVKTGVIMGIDPGFKNGCKIGIIDNNNRILFTGKLNLTTSVNGQDVKLKELLDQYEVGYIALGNGTGCNQVESLICILLTNIRGPTEPKLTTIGEAGVSIWSVSSEAEKEFPNMEAGLRSAISLARRLRDPISELSRVPPQNLSVGQYQHDLPNAKTVISMKDTLQEFVSFSGVDLNTAGAHVLQHVAGLGPGLAEKIVKCRENMPDCRFVSREQLRSAVKGLGEKTFEQCAGFVKIYPSCQNQSVIESKIRKIGQKWQSDSRTVNDDDPSAKKRKTGTAKTTKQSKTGEKYFEENPFDVTNIHPKQDRLNEMSNLKRARVFIDRKEALKKFSGSTNEEVKLNSEYAGKVVNVTDFGAFVELRNCCDLKSSKVVGLAPMSLNGPGLIQSLQIGQNVQVKVTKIDVVKGHFTLKIIE